MHQHCRYDQTGCNFTVKIVARECRIRENRLICVDVLAPNITDQLTTEYDVRVSARYYNCERSPYHRNGRLRGNELRPRHLNCDYTHKWHLFRICNSLKLNIVTFLFLFQLRRLIIYLFIYEVRTHEKDRNVFHFHAFICVLRHALLNTRALSRIALT